MSRMTGLHPHRFRGFWVDVAARFFTREYNRRLRAHGLTHIQYFILLLLAEEDGRRPSDLGVELRLDASSLTRLLDRLEAARIVERRPDADDRRVIAVTLLEKGRRLVEELESVGTEMRDLESDLGPTSDEGDEPVSGRIILDAERALGEVSEIARGVELAFASFDREPVIIKPPSILRVATRTSRRSVMGRAFVHFAELVRERTQGRLEVELHVPYDLPGGEIKLFIDVGAGNFAVGGVTAPHVANLLRDAQLLELPYLFDNREHARRVLNGPLGKAILARASDYGLLGLAICENGTRSLTTRDIAVHSPTDLRGVRMRTLESPVSVYLAEALGATPVPMPYENLVDAIRAGEIDVQENTLVNIADLHLGEVQQYLIQTRHIFASQLVVGNPAIFASLGELRPLVEDALAEAIREAHETAAQIEDEALDELRRSMTVIELEPQEIEAFVEATRLVYERVGRSAGSDAIRRITAAAEAARKPLSLAAKKSRRSS
ncbi:MAG TPA: TRAP transporter substrate-binding protein DctP [Candidatus Baltobacteraceae bacterium]|nr:TRAP transporter substrate-binding protein DctP [Candidatus Baltobacteraceae bacterium]